MSFGTPTPTNNSNTPAGDDDAFAGMGLPAAGADGASLTASPIGVFDAVCTGFKVINAESYQGVALEFTLEDPEFGGEEFAILATKVVPGMQRAAAKKAVREWMRIGSALAAMGCAVDPQTQMPLEGPASVAGLRCRLATSTYAKQGTDNPTIVWGRPKSRMNAAGVQVGFPDDEKGADGRFRDYGCGVLPPE